jgi:hypothetical protein
MNTTTEAPATGEAVLPAEEVAPRISPRRARIDAPHPPSAETAMAASASALEVVEQPSADLIAAITGQSPEALRQQLELQADQLSEHLRERLREVDRREAHLNARVAQLESDLRASRVWLREQEHEFAQREAEMRQQLEDARQCGEHAPTESVDGADLETARRELSDREHQLQLKENGIRERRLETERQASALRHAQQLWDQERSRQEAELARQRERHSHQFHEQSAQRDEQLHLAEAQIARDSEQLARDRDDFAADRQAWEQRRAVQASALDERAKLIEGELAEHRLRLDARAEWIEREKNGLEQVRSDITDLHRQSLEMRLVAEQLWSQISGRMSPAEVTQSIAQARRKLAEHYRLEEQALDKRKDELLAVAQRVADQHRELTQLQGGLKGWVAARQAEVEEQAANLARREQELEAQQEAIRQSRVQWLTERQSLEQQLRELRAQLREPPAA